MLICRDVAEMATDYMEGTLPPLRWLGVRLHLAVCSLCRAYVDQLRRTTRLLRRATLPAPPPELSTRLVDAATRDAPPAIDGS